MKNQRMIIAAVVVVVILTILFFMKKKEDFTLPDPNPVFAQMCPPGYKFTCISKSLPGMQMPPPLPPGMSNVCPETYLAGCLPAPENLLEPMMPTPRAPSMPMVAPPPRAPSMPMVAPPQRAPSMPMVAPPQRAPSMPMVAPPPRAPTQSVGFIP